MPGLHSSESDTEVLDMRISDAIIGLVLIKELLIFSSITHTY